MAKYHDGAVSGSRRVVNVLLTVLLAALCVVWLYPVLLILINSLKDELAISTATVFELPTQATVRRAAQLYLRHHPAQLPAIFRLFGDDHDHLGRTDSAVLLDVRRGTSPA